MRLSLTLAAPLLVLLATGGVQAAASPEQINSVLANCPATTAGDCSNAVSEFANGLSEADRDTDLLNLANSLAQKADATGPDACVDIKAGIEVAAGAASSTNAREQIAGVGEPLCSDDDTATGSVAPSMDYVPPQSVVEQNDSTRN